MLDHLAKVSDIGRRWLVQKNLLASQGVLPAPATELRAHVEQHFAELNALVHFLKSESRYPYPLMQNVLGIFETVTGRPQHE